MKKPGKLRVDALLVERGLCESRSSAAASVLSGRVFSGEARVDKPGTALYVDAPLRLSEPPRYVSRGGFKLEGALDGLGLSPEGQVWLDVGASTGGFTDCLLQRGAIRVYAVDVGRGLLAESLRRDPRVICREGQNARHLTRGDFPEPIDAVVVDASFIGLDKLLPAIGDVLGPGGFLLAMIKPQFEAGKQLARRHRGVISDPELRARIVDEVVERVVAAGFEPLGRRDSELPGPKGNVEHFLWAVRRPRG